MVVYITFYKIKFHIFKCKIHFYEEKCVYLPYENRKSPSRLPRFLKDLFPAFMLIHKKNELFLYYCAWQSELGHQGSKGSKYIGLNRVSPYILNSMYGVYGGHQNAKPSLTQVFSYGRYIHFSS